MQPEKVLVVPTSCLWDRVPHSNKGLITKGLEHFVPVVTGCGSFIERSAAEQDPSYKQIIPYAVVRHSDSYFLLQRRSAQSEQRLHHKLSIGVGGHINPAQVTPDTDLIRDGLKREINEELNISSEYQERFIGLINDDTNDVGRVHLGVLFEITSGSPEITVKETHKMLGSWVLIDRLEENYEHLETWSQIVYDSYLCSRTLSLCNGTSA